VDLILPCCVLNGVANSVGAEHGFKAGIILQSQRVTDGCR